MEENIEYESVIIVRPEVVENEKKLEELKNKYVNLINNNGKVTNYENLGIKMLAYEIQKQKTGLYIVINFESKRDFIAELERNYRIDDNVMKFIVVKKF